ncbi:hypothetical protein AABB24_037862, partial [Solanum stoloniferum]
SPLSKSAASSLIFFPARPAAAGLHRLHHSLFLSLPSPLLSSPSSRNQRPTVAPANSNQQHRREPAAGNKGGSRPLAYSSSLLFFSSLCRFCQQQAAGENPAASSSDNRRQQQHEATGEPLFPGERNSDSNSQTRPGRAATPADEQGEITITEFARTSSFRLVLRRISTDLSGWRLSSEEYNHDCKDEGALVNDDEVRMIIPSAPVMIAKEERELVSAPPFYPYKHERLDNGFVYLIKQLDGQKEKDEAIKLKLIVKAGSICENEEQ